MNEWLDIKPGMLVKRIGPSQNIEGIIDGPKIEKGKVYKCKEILLGLEIRLEGFKRTYDLTRFIPYKELNTNSKWF